MKNKIKSIIGLLLVCVLSTINAQSPTGAGIPTYTNGTVTAPHFGGYGTAPTLAYGAGAGTSPTAATFDSGASDSAGTVTMTMGSSTTTGIVATVTFNVAYATAPHVVLYPANQYSATAAAFVYVTATTTTFVIHDVTTAITASQACVYNYVVIQ